MSRHPNQAETLPALLDAPHENREPKTGDKAGDKAGETITDKDAARNTTYARAPGPVLNWHTPPDEVFTVELETRERPGELLIMADGRMAGQTGTIRGQGGSFQLACNLAGYQAKQTGVLRAFVRRERGDALVQVNAHGRIREVKQ